MAKQVSRQGCLKEGAGHSRDLVATQVDFQGCLKEPTGHSRCQMVMWVDHQAHLPGSAIRPECLRAQAMRPVFRTVMRVVHSRDLKVRLVEHWQYLLVEALLRVYLMVLVDPAGQEHHQGSREDLVHQVLQWAR